ncbi:MAG: nicotinate phosphoribosyltransferase [Candidatus Bathyarchaeota archaeon]|nr:nicotinate phosphoribosyltransferase [Candidatus Bathyarchaeota archaeon]
MHRFYVASDEEVRTGETTDIYFTRTEKILKEKGLEHVRAVAEVTVPELPMNWPWGTLCGVEEEVYLFEGRNVDVYAMPEGTIFRPLDYRGVPVPVMRIEGEYGKFAVLETALLGLVCQASGIATAASRVRKVAGDRLALSFGVRRMHPSIAPMVSRAAYIGGLDGVSCVLSAKRMGIKATGTMPHSLIIIFRDQVKAWKAFDELMPKDVPRIALTDTYLDEKVESLMAVEALGKKLWGIRLDTPGSRKGSFEDIVREVRWELDLKGFKDVKIFVSGGLDEKSVKSLSEAGADGFGVGTRVSDAPTINFAMDIVEVEGRPSAKRGKFGGKKNVWRCPKCLIDIVLPFSASRPVCPKCGSKTEPILKPLIMNGKLATKLPKATEIRSYVLKQLEKVTLEI